MCGLCRDLIDAIVEVSAWGNTAGLAKRLQAHYQRRHLPWAWAAEGAALVCTPTESQPNCAVCTSRGRCLAVTTYLKRRCDLDKGHPPHHRNSEGGVSISWRSR